MPDVTSSVELIEGARPMVYAVALAQHAWLGGELDELVGDGMVALVEAAERFDPERGVPFTAFARHRVRGAMVDGYRRLRRTGRNHSSGEPVRFVSIDAVDDYPWGGWCWEDDGSCWREPWSPSAEADAIDREDLLELLRKVEALPRPLRAVVEMMWEDGYSRVGSGGRGDGRKKRLAEREGVDPACISQRLAEVRRRLAA